MVRDHIQVIWPKKFLTGTPLQPNRVVQSITTVTRFLLSDSVSYTHLHGTFDDYIGPIPGGSGLYRNVLNVSPVRFPAYYEPDEAFQHEKHILYGNDQTAGFMNPYAEMTKGYREESKTVVMAQFELHQNLNRWVKGLNLRFLGSTTRNSAFDLSRAYNPYFYRVARYDRLNDKYFLEELNPESATEYLSYNPVSYTHL